MNERIGFGQRLLAYLIDWITIGVVGGILGSILGGMLGFGAGGAAAASGAAGSDAAAAGALVGIMGAIAGAAIGMGILSIGWVVWEGLTGQALGKKLLKIRIKAADGSVAGPDKLFTRAAIKYIYLLMGLIGGLTGINIINQLGSLAGLVVFVGCFFVLGQNRQALHDIVAKTAVFKA
ncbi:MAG TPA: RDD family protein [Pirellulaceae bacterium]|nr:RDD family protein [Pirellulaceae bacterium]